MSEATGRFLMVAGVVMAIVGAAIAYSPRVRSIRLFRLPGDIAIQRDGFSFYMPITSMVLLSAVLTLIAWIAGSLRR